VNAISTKNVIQNIVTAPLPSITSQYRCPLTVPKPGTFLFGDKYLCNIYHECNCNQTLTVNSNGTMGLCSLVKTNVCPMGTVFSNSSFKCEPIESYGCETSYLQSANLDFYSNKNRNQSQQLSSLIAKPNIEHYHKSFPLEPTMNVTGLTEFSCPTGANDRFADPNVCNLFHVCVSRGDQTFDQPFLCPFSTVFRVVDANTMYCDKKQATDCINKAFYRSTDQGDMDISEKSILVEISTNTTQCPLQSSYDDLVEDKQYCNIYHMCKEGKVYSFICDSQLLFNPASKICDFPINVACLDKEIYRVDESTRSQLLARMKELNAALAIQEMQEQQQQQGQTAAHNEKAASSSPAIGQNSHTLKNGTQMSVYGVRVELNCPIGTVKNYMMPDRRFCNVYHKCQGNYGYVYVCEPGQAYDIISGGSGPSCNTEDMVNCAGKFILTESGQKAGKSIKPPATSRFLSHQEDDVNSSREQRIDSLTAAAANGPTADKAVLNYMNNYNIVKHKQTQQHQQAQQQQQQQHQHQDVPQAIVDAGGSGGHNQIGVEQNENREELVTGIPFDCRNKANGHWRDGKFCDVFHACISGEQRKTYSCAQVGDRNYFDEVTKRYVVNIYMTDDKTSVIFS
jgi:hypothetical protein